VDVSLSSTIEEGLLSDTSFDATQDMPQPQPFHSSVSLTVVKTRLVTSKLG
jgi:hypothetical protein